MLHFAKFFTATLCLAIGFCLQVFHELNLQLDCSVAAVHKAVFSHFNRVTVCDFYILHF